MEGGSIKAVFASHALSPDGGGGGGRDVASSVAPTHEDAERFSKLFNDGARSTMANSSQAPVQALGTAPLPKPGMHQTLGDAILDKLGAVGDRYRAERGLATQAMNDAGHGSMSLSRMLQLQMNISDMSLSVDVISKGVSKVGQHLEQLTKLQ